ncbi:MAG TPA: hypothetical protein VFT99_02520 [Roseiflexaceae bacterium]|nr:hypothetical protein [Roseiflexaceae bacterium]
MIDLRLWSMARVAGLLLVLGDVVVLPGLLMFTFRGGQRGGAPPSPAYYGWERGLIMGAVVLTAIGFMVLEGHLQSTAGRILARIAAFAYLFAGVVGVVGEALNLSLGYEKSYILMVVYVVIAFLAQAALGGALLQSGLLPAWICWAAMLWNLAWLVALPLFSPRDIYFPVLHHVAPLLIGIALLWNAP